MYAVEPVEGDDLALFLEGAGGPGAEVVHDEGPVIAAGQRHVHVGDDHVVGTVLVQIDDDDVAGVDDAGLAGEGERREVRHPLGAVALVEQVPVHAVVDRDDVHRAVTVEVADGTVVRGERVDLVVLGEETLVERVVVRDADVVRAVRRQADDVVEPVTVHVDDGVGDAEVRREHLRGGEPQCGLVAEEAVAVVDQQAVVEVEDLRCWAVVVVAEEEVRRAVAGHIAGGDRAEPRPRGRVHLRDPGVLVTEPLPDAVDFAQVHVDPRV